MCWDATLSTLTRVSNQCTFDKLKQHPQWNLARSHVGISLPTVWHPVLNGDSTYWIAISDRANEMEPSGDIYLG